MRMRWIAAILVVSVGGMQASAATMAAARQAQMAQRATLRQTAVAAQSAVGAGPTAATGTIDVPVGTKVQLNLVSPVMSLSTKAGDTVRAVVAFPVTVGNQVAIPAGTFVEGQFVSARAAGTKPKKGTSGPALQIHFTKLVYANGYTVALDAQESAAGEGDRRRDGGGVGG
jgi:type IV secretion system protein VirB10